MKHLLAACMILAAMVAQAQEADKITSKGNVYYQAGQYDAAEQQYRKVLAADPQNETAMYNLSNTLQRQKKYEEAIRV